MKSKFEHPYQIPICLKKGELNECSIETKMVLINAAILYTGTKYGAARMLGINRGTLYNILGNYILIQP